MARSYRFRFYATVSDRGQIFIPKALQNYFEIRKRDMVVFTVSEDGRVYFQPKGEGGKNG